MEDTLIEEIQHGLWQLKETMAAAQFWYTQCEIHGEQTYQERVETLQQQYRDGIADAAALYEPAHKEYPHRMTQYKKDYKTILEQSKSEYMGQIKTLEASRQNLLHSTHHLLREWTDPDWDEWLPAKNGFLPEIIRFGQLHPGGHWNTLIVPACLPLLVHGRSVLFKIGGTAKKEAVRAIQSVLLRLLAMVPPGKLHFTFIDPAGLGQNVAPFMRLADYDRDLVTDRAWSEKSHIDRQLTDLTDYIGDIIQNFLRNQYTTVEEYHQQTGKMVGPYRILVVMDFPMNFSEDTAHRLLSVVQNGPRCGVYTLILHDPEQNLPYGCHLADLERSMTTVEWIDGRFICQNPFFHGLHVELDAPPAEKLFDRIVNDVGRAAAKTPPHRLSKSGSVSEKHFPLGATSTRNRTRINAEQTAAQPALIPGEPDAEDFGMFQALIKTLTATYHPDEVELYLIDFKQGIELQRYALHQLPQGRVAAANNDREYGIRMLEDLDVKLRQREKLFRHIHVHNLETFCRKTEQPMPRLLLLVNRFQEFFIEEDALASKASQLLNRLVRQGQAVGIHVFLGS